MTAPAAYTVHEADLARDRELILGLWRGNLGQDVRMMAKYDWFYRQCPYGEPLTLLLRHEDSGEWVGVASAGPRRMSYDAREVTAGVLVDLAVVPEHRSLGPALMLQMELKNAASKRFDLVYGFPNPKAAAVFKRVGYVAVGRLTRHARVLRHGDYLRRRIPAFLASLAGTVLDLVDRARLRIRALGTRAHWQDTADAALGGLWRPEATGKQLAAVRDQDFLSWRFDQSPLLDVRYLVVSGKGNALSAWFACEVREAGLHVVDAWSVHAGGGPDRSHLAALLLAARAAGHASVSVEHGDAAATEGWRASGFVARESRQVFGCARDALGETWLAGAWLTSADEDE